MVVTNTTNANIIDLTDAGVAGDEAQLIAPVQVEGHWYYHWDRSGNGTNASTGSLNGGADTTTHDVLDGIFANDISGTPNSTVPNADGNYGTTNIYRYATLNGVNLALPTAGETPLVTDAYRPGTAVADGATPNATYDDLLAIWDAHNGSGTGKTINGMPSGWPAGAGYWSATPSTNCHASVGMNDGYVYDLFDGNSNLFAALEVL